MAFLLNGMVPYNTGWAVHDVVAQSLSGKIKLTWTNPVSPSLTYVRVLRKLGGFVVGFEDPLGVQIYQGLAEEFIDTNVEALKTYYYTVFGINDTTSGGYDPFKVLFTADNDLGATTPLKSSTGWTYPMQDPILVPPAATGSNYRGVTNEALWRTEGVPTPQPVGSAWDYDSNAQAMINADFGFTELIYGSS